MPQVAAMAIIIYIFLRQSIEDERKRHVAALSEIEKKFK